MMGLWALLSMLDYQQTSQPQQTAPQMASASATRKASEAVLEVKYLCDRIDRLTLVCMAMWVLMQERSGLSEEDLMEKIKMIDLMDGKADGKFTKQIKKCPKCGRVMSPKHSRCLYCGATDLQAGAFDPVL